MEGFSQLAATLLPDDGRDINRSMHGRTHGGQISAVMPVTALLLCAALGLACEDPIERSRPQPEVSQSTVKLELPEVPAFDVPAPHPDGSHSVREMRLKSAKLLNSEVRVKGFVTWIYDCVSELQGPDESAADVRKRVEEDPTLCQRPHFFIGDSPDTSGERSVWVVDVPRKPRPDELRNMGRQERASLQKPPRIDLGDEVLVTGVWNRESPKGFSNSEGLLVYKDLENLSEGE